MGGIEHRLARAHDLNLILNMVGRELSPAFVVPSAVEESPINRFWRISLKKNVSPIAHRIRQARRRLLKMNYERSRTKSLD
jgi:hypothetical protein